MNTRRLLLVIGFIAVPFIPLTARGVEETNISMNLWNRYTLKRQSGEFTSSEFNLPRGYLRIEPTFNDKIKGRFNIDIFSDNDGLDGAGLKIKYAYVDFKELIPIPESKVTAGLIKHYFGTIYDWDYTTPEKALEDIEGVVSSTDYGIGLYGYIPQGYGEYTLAVLNGEGYKKAGSDINLYPEFLVNVRFIPIPGVTIGGSVLYENRAADPDSTEKRMAYAGVGHLAYGPVEVWGEYLMSDYDDLKSNGFMVMPVIKIASISDIDVNIVGRYDMWDPNTDVDNDGYSRVMGGLNWHLLRGVKNKPAVFLQLFFERTMFEDDSDPRDEIMAQFRWSFSNKI